MDLLTHQNTKPIIFSNEMQTMWTEMNEVLTERQTERCGGPVMVLPPGVTAKRRLRAFKVYVLVHTWWIIVCHPTITYTEQFIYCFSWCNDVFKKSDLWCVLYLHRRRAWGCHIGFGPGVGHLRIFDIGVFSLLHLIPLQRDNMVQADLV